MRSFYSTDSECTRTDDSDDDGEGTRGASAATAQSSESTARRWNKKSFSMITVTVVWFQGVTTLGFSTPRCHSTPRRRLTSSLCIDHRIRVKTSLRGKVRKGSNGLKTFKLLNTVQPTLSHCSIRSHTHSRAWVILPKTEPVATFVQRSLKSHVASSRASRLFTKSWSTTKRMWGLISL